MIDELFTWDGIEQHVKMFVKHCLHCLTAKDHGRTTLLGSQMHASKPNEIIHYDYLKIRDGEYILVIKDDLSHFVELVLCNSPDHFHVVDALLDWSSRYGMPLIHISDQGTHFKNKVCAELERLYGVRHRFTPTYTPHANGTVEVVNRHILKLIRALQSEFRLRDLKALIPIIQGALNLNLSPSLGYLCPTEVFTGLKTKSQVEVVFDSNRDELKNRK